MTSLLFLEEICHQFIRDLQHTSWLEFIAVIAGIFCVWLIRKEMILNYPAGLINTVAYIYLSLKMSLFGEASVNLYYTILNIYGWVLWSRKDGQDRYVLRVMRSTPRELRSQVVFFLVGYLVVFFSLTYLKQQFAPLAIPWADAFASATAYTGMWVMTKKKVENWYWWIATNCASIPLYFVKHYVFTSVYYFVLLIIAIGGLLEWNRRAKDIHYAA